MRAMQTDRQITEIKSNGIDCLPAIQWQQNIRWITTDNRIFARVSRIDLCMAREWTAQTANQHQMQSIDPNHDEWQNLLTLYERGASASQ